MAVGPETRAMIDKFNAATTAVGVRLAAIMADADLTDEETAAFQAEVDRLTAMGQDPNNPVPPVPPPA